jgi:hypothetical protein
MQWKESINRLSRKDIMDSRNIEESFHLDSNKEKEENLTTTSET